MTDTNDARAVAWLLNGPACTEGTAPYAFTLNPDDLKSLSSTWTAEPLYPASVVDGLRARVKELTDKLDDVVAASLDFVEAADARDNEETATQYPDHYKRLREYKAARDHLNSILPGPTP